MIGATFVSCSQDQTAMLWNGMLKITQSIVFTLHDDDNGSRQSKKARSESGKTRTPIMTLQGHRECVSSVQWMDQTTLLTSSWDHTMKIWDLNLEGVKSEITGNKSFFDASYSKLNGLIITASPDKNLRLYDPRSNQGAIVKNTYLGHSQWVQSVTWAPHDEFMFLSGSYDNQVKLWDHRSPKAPLYDLLGHDDKVLDVDWSNPKFMVSGGSDNTVRIFKSKKAVNKPSDV
ncbi:unnamed protein product [Hermetia illucens]|uniref:Ribosome biogenesis protein WDR12 homolog n=1 Tax=Hermetia illucens TaxID=343691 RepID=A0A7R8YNU9_HERIL|nr:unnamed protein product [Hermetia illucens]